MEAMRALQRQKETKSSKCVGAKAKPAAPACSSVCEIVDYVAENFRTDGDLDAQVRTALKRTCCQGFVKYERNDAYRLIGPFVCQLAKTQVANSSTSMSSLVGRRSIHDPCEPNATPYNRNSSGDSDQAPASSEMDLSIPTSVAEDILWNRVQNQGDNCNAGDQEPAQNPGASNENRNQGTNCRPRNDDSPCQQGNATSGPSGQNQSPAADNEAAATILTPAGELEVTYSNGDDDDEDFGEEDEEEGRRAADEDVEEDDDDEEEEEEDDEDDDEDDASLLNVLNVRNRRPRKGTRDQELKRWIRQCRKDCERRAQRGENNR